MPRPYSSQGCPRTPIPIYPPVVPPRSSPPYLPWCPIPAFPQQTPGPPLPVLPIPMPSHHRRHFGCHPILKTPPFSPPHPAVFSPEKVPEKLDAIVIGSGIGGLAVAVLLAKVGRRVLVLEQHGRLGGCCHAFSEKGFEFDTGTCGHGERRGLRPTAFRRGSGWSVGTRRVALRSQRRRMAELPLPPNPLSVGGRGGGAAHSSAGTVTCPAGVL